MPIDFTDNTGMPTIRCGPVVLRPIALTHATERYVAWLNDPEVNLYLETRFRTQTMDALTDYIKAAVKNPGVAQFAIHTSDDDTFIGNAKLSEIKERHFSAVVGYLIGDRRCWGHGIGTNAVGALCAFGFRKVGLKKIRASCYSSNAGSVALLKKVGFEQEGVQRYQVESNGGREDVYDFGLPDFAFDDDLFPAAFE
jgi:RimJ/RimL family protein N-acetyltransferase